ncbi:MAG: diguanylate cyclase [Proteobacteria bacterium]|nr:diguanylate cyclase [Pseudomonadota bacterium]
MDWIQFGFLTVECLVGAAFVLALVRLREPLGLGPLFVVLGSWQFLQTLLAISFYVPIGGDFSVSPGSTSLFAGNLFAVLAVYVRVGVVQTRRLVFGLIVANLILTVWTLLLGWHLAAGETVNLLGVPMSIFAVNARTMLVGTLVTALDVVIVSMVWEVLGRLVPDWLTLRAVLSLVLVLATDTFLFATGAFGGTDLWLPILVSGLLGKSWCALVYGLVFGAWLHAAGAHYAQVGRGPIRGVLADWGLDAVDDDAVKKIRDAESGLYSASFFLDVLDMEVTKALRAERDAVLVLLDLDQFRAYTRLYGPEIAGRIPRVLGLTLLDEASSQDLMVRYADDQYVLFLHHGGTARGHAVATAVRRRLRAALANADPALPDVTFTAGVAEVEPECTSGRALTFTAESRVHRGKLAGRNQIVVSDR